MAESSVDREKQSASRPMLRVIPSVSLPELLRTERASRKLTQSEAAEFFGVRPQTIGAWEAGRTPPQSRFYPKLAEYLHLASGEEVSKLLSPPTAATGQQPANVVREEPTVVGLSPELEIRLNISRHLAAGERLTAEMIDLFRRLLDEPPR